MRKILSAALALVCVWFATPAFANCNLTQRIINKTYTAGVGSGDSDGHAVISDITYKENTPYTITIDVEPSNITFSEGGNLLWWVIKYTDGSFSYTGVTSSNYNDGRVSVTTSSNKTVESIAGLTPHPRWTGGTLKVSNLQIEEGTTATAYTPYNPLCETCDGTVVNYVSATGTGVQNGTPTPENPIEPVFYQQGNMVLRKVGDYADTYDATTGKITRRIGVKVLDGTESWSLYNTRYVSSAIDGTAKQDVKIISSHFENGSGVRLAGGMSRLEIFQTAVPDLSTAAQLKNWLAQQYQAGTPVTVYYPLAEETTEDWTETSYCSAPIKIATTKYNETAFGPLNTALQNAISVVDSVVSQTITQAGRIADLQAQKQTRPADDPSDANNAENCPAGKKCLLVEDASGIPHWYEIVENAYGLPSGYTELEYIQSDGESYLIVPYRVNNKTVFYCRYNEIQKGPQTASAIFGVTNVPDVAKANYGILRLLNGAGSYNRMGWGDSTSGSVIDVNAPQNLDTWYEVLYDQNKLYQDNVLYATSATPNGTEWAADYDLGVFARNSTSVSMPAIAKISSVWAKENSEYKINLIPVKRNSDGAIGMFDTVSGEFFTNKGSGSFIAGPVTE